MQIELNVENMSNELYDAILDAFKAECEKRGVVYHDEWSYTSIDDWSITANVTVDMRD